MRLSIGVAVGAERVRAVALRHGRILWVAESTVADSFGAAVAEALAGARLPRWPRPRVTVALGPALTQTRRLTGLPTTPDPRLLERIVAENTNRFFLANGRRLDTTGVRLEEPGTAWAAAFDADIVRQVEHTCRDTGLRSVRFVPSVVCLAHAIGSGQLDWFDGQTVTRIEVADGVLRACLRRRSGRTTNSENASLHGDEPLTPVGRGLEHEAVELTPVAALEKYGARFADAYGAATLPPAEPLIRAERHGSQGSIVSGPRVIPAASAAALGIALAAGAPGAAAVFATRNAEAQLREIETERRRAESVYDELEKVDAALRDVSDLRGRGLPALELLAELTRLLPDGSALVSLRIEADSGHVIGIAPRAATIIEALSRSRLIVAPEVSGSVTRETVGDRDVERVHVRFNVAGAGAMP